jgi:alpha-1,2-mannosyltransferase
MVPAEPEHRLPYISERAFLIALLILFAAVSIQYTIKTLDLRDGKQVRSAILRWREQLLRMDGGENIYISKNYPNPPIMALLLRPLADLPPLAGALLWYYLKVGMALTAFALTFRLAEDSGRPFPSWAKALTVLLSLRPILSDLTHGNVNLFILFLVVAALAAFRRGWDVLAGVVMALAIACKVTPALFVAYFVWKRAWRTLGGVGLGLVLFFFVIPAAVLGWNVNAEYLGSWVDQMIKPFLVGGIVTSEHSNQSLPGLIHRLLTVSPSSSAFENDVYTPTEYHNLLALGPTAAGWLVKGCMAMFSAIGIWCCRTPTRPRASAALAAEYALVVLGMLLFSERTWKHHGVTLVLPFGVLCYALATAEVGGRMKTYLIGTLIAVQVALATTSTGLLPDDAWAILAQVYGAYTWAFILLAAALVAVLRRGAETAASTVLTTPVQRAA